MWILNFIPDSVLLILIRAVITAGILGIVIGFFIKFIPWINIYRTPILLVSIVVLCAGIYMYGGYGTEMHWRQQVEEIKNQLAQAEKQSQQINEKIIYRTKEKVLVVNRAVEVTKKEIEYKEKIINKNCQLNADAVNLYNQAVSGNVDEKGSKE